VLRAPLALVRYSGSNYHSSNRRREVSISYRSLRRTFGFLPQQCKFARESLRLFTRCAERAYSSRKIIQRISG
jgi:hypothetical protein